MAYNDVSTGAAIASAVAAVAAGISKTAPITASDQAAIWKAAEAAFKGTGIPTLVVSSSGATLPHTAGAAATITALPGTVT